MRKVAHLGYLDVSVTLRELLTHNTKLLN